MPGLLTEVHDKANDGPRKIRKGLGNVGDRQGRIDRSTGHVNALRGMSAYEDDMEH